jgi:hypothetical protein
MKNIIKYVLTTIVAFLMMSISTHVFAAEVSQPNFAIDENNVLYADTDFAIQCFSHPFQAAYNTTTERYEIDLSKAELLFNDESKNDSSDDTVHYFTCNNITYAFCVNSQYLDWGYCDVNLYTDLPDDYKDLLGMFHTPIVIGFYNEDDTTMGLTNFQPNLVTPDGVYSRFIYVRINKKYSKANFNMADTIIHELGHAIIDDIICNMDADYATQVFISNNNLIVSSLINSVATESLGGNYGYIYSDISDYAATTIAEIPSEAFAQVYLMPENSTTFNKMFVDKMLETWVSLDAAA